MDQSAWEGVLARYGQRVTLVRGGEEKEVRAFFQPVAEKSPGETPTPLGVAPAGKWLYLGPAGEALEEATQLLWDGRAFGFLRHRVFPAGESAGYRWALLYELDEVKA